MARGSLIQTIIYVLAHFSPSFEIEFRYMMYIRGPRQVFFIDRDNAVFQIEGLSFVSSRDRSRHLLDTLVDGEMVIDKAGGKQHPRYLIYDLVSLEGNQIMKENFSTRYRTIMVMFLFNLILDFLCDVIFSLFTERNN